MPNAVATVLAGLACVCIMKNFPFLTSPSSFKLCHHKGCFEFECKFLSSASSNSLRHDLGIV
jgi:hypothetical protein